jgi:hypothetical protein
LYIIQPLGPWLQKLFDFQLLQSQAPDMELVLPEPEQSTSILTGIWPDIIRGVIFWGIILILLALIFYFLRSKRGKRKIVGLESESEDLLKAGEARVIILNALQGALTGITGRFKPPPRQPAIAEIRRIYARLLVLGEELEIPRSISQTPNEYLRDLKKTFVNQETELEEITISYIDLRYGESPELAEQVQQVTRAWEVVEREGKRLKTIRQALASKASKASPPV